MTPTEQSERDQVQFPKHRNVTISAKRYDQLVAAEARRDDLERIRELDSAAILKLLRQRDENERLFMEANRDARREKGEKHQLLAALKAYGTMPDHQWRENILASAIAT